MDRNLSMGLDGRFKLVALRKESVDRNYAANAVDQILPVALRKESVDRNCAMQIVIIVVDSRSPQGERG